MAKEVDPILQDFFPKNLKTKLCDKEWVLQSLEDFMSVKCSGVIEIWSHLQYVNGLPEQSRGWAS